ncbi:MAG: hypothetical protein PHS15_01200 [Clostridiaceae bacterium]|nr:hypothetical protein [Clostridiaceae bacterium]
MLKRTLICFVAALLVFAAVPEIRQVNAAGPGPVEYTRQTLERPVLTLRMTQDNDFLSNPDTKAGFYSYGWSFSNGEGNGLSTSQYNRYVSTHTFSFPGSLSKITDIKNRGQLYIGYTLSMCPSRHSHISHPFTEKLGFQYTGIYDNRNETYFTYSGGDNVQNVLKNYGNSISFTRVNNSAGNLNIGFGLSGSCTAHGNPYITDSSVYFADRKEPSISKISTTADKEGTIPKQYYGAGQTVYIHLEYNEPIRFSDNSSNHDNVTLALDVARKATASNAGVETQYAKLVALNDTKLTFRYDIPSTINNTAAGAEVTDHYIAGIKESSLQSSLYGSGSFELKYPFANTDMVLPSKYQSNLSYTRTDCLITDLVGNPAKSFTATRLWPYAYMDTAAPELAYIEIEGSMIDKNYTGELDAPDLDRSTVFAGVGDTLSFRVWFSDYINMAGVDLLKVQPVLNIRDMAGNPVRFHIAGWGNGKRNKDDKFESGYLDFMGLWGLVMEEGMTPIEYPEVTDKRITIDSLSISSEVKLCDKSGNEFAQAGINIPKDLNITANKKVFLDVLKPVVTTPSALSNGKHAPVYYSGSDSLQFCFPVAASDDTSAGTAYVSRISTKDGCGAFEWISAEPFSFKYKVTGSMDKPAEAPDTWQTGTANNKYSFTQIAEGNYIHIALIGAENYNIADTTMKVYESDFAGNVGEGSFPLDYLHDTRGPDITKVSFETGTDSTGDQGYIKAALKLEDPSMVDISSVYYKWVNTATGDVTDWQQYTGTVNTSAKTMTLDFSLTGLEKGMKHDYRLLIKAKDHSAVISGGNETITDPGLSYLIDLTYPAYTFSHSEGYGAEPQFIIKDLLKNPDTGEESTVIVMIKDPAGATGNEYFVRPITTGSYNGCFGNSNADGDVLGHFWYNDYFNSSDSSQESRFWRYHTVTEGEEKQYIFDATAPTMYKLMSGSTEAEKKIGRRLQTMMDGKYYGNIEAKLITGYGRLGTTEPVTLTLDKVPAVFEAVYSDNRTFKYYSTASDNFKVLDIYEITVPVGETQQIHFKALDLEGNIIDESLILGGYVLDPWLYSNYISYIPESANVDVKNYTLKADAPNYVLDGNGNQDQNTSGSIHSITLTPQSNDLGMAQGWTNPSQGSKFRSSIDNEVFSLDIANNVISSWELNDINFDSEDTYIGLFLISSPDDGAPVNSTVPIWKVTPAALAGQSFTIPAGVAQYNGHYQVKVQLSTWGGGTDTSAVDCYVDRTGVTEFSPKSAKHSFDYETASGVVTISDTYSYTPADSCIYLGSQNGKKVTLSFGADAGSVNAEGIAYRQMFIKAWNASAETAENTAPAGARWYDISTGEFAKEYQISFFNTTDELKSAVLGDVDKAELGLLRNTENVVHYQIIGANGAASAVRTLLVDVSDELPEFEMELSPETSAVKLQSATAFIKKLQSATMKEMVVKTVAAAPAAVGSEGFNIIDNKAYSFYTANAYGNYGFYTVTAPFVDSEEPMKNHTFAVFGFDGDMNGRNNLGIIYNDNLPEDPSRIKLFLKYEDAYMARLQAQNGLEVNPEGYMQVKLPEIPAGESHIVSEYEGETAPGGIYQIFVTKENPYYDGDKFNIWLYMDYLYDSSKAEYFDMPVSFYFEDQAGNRSEAFSDSIKVFNQKPAITGAESNHNTIESILNTEISFNKPVKLISPDSFTHTNYDLLIKDYPQNSLPAGFAFSRDAFTVYGTGEYKVTFKDIFGITYTENYTPVLNFAKYGLDVSFSTTEPVRGNIKVTIKPQSEGTHFYLRMVPPNTKYDKLEFSETYGQYLKSASVTLSENGHIYLYLRAKKGEYNWDYKYLCIPITNILSHAPEAQDTWYYPEFASNTLPQGVTETTHKVTVFITSAYPNRPIQGAEGYNLSYTFPYGTNAGDAYTFQYTDAVGNIGTKTVNCPVSVVRPLLPQEDKEAPNFIVKVYGKYGDIFRESEAWNSPVTSTPYDADGNKLPPVTVSAVNSHTTFKELLDAVSWTRGYKLDFEISDSSPTKLVLMKPGDTTAGMTYANAANYQSNISGVSINGNIVTVTDKDAEFKIAVVDDGNEHVTSGSIIEARAYSSVKEMNFGGTDNWWIDLMPPTAETAIEYSDFYKLVCFFKISDTQSTPTVVSPLWTTMTDAASPFYTKYKDWYYKEFGENAAININFRDEAYNMANETLDITGIDSSAPKAEVKWWRPSAYSIDWNGEATQYKTQAPNHKTNSTVNVGISFDKNITAMKLWRWDGTAYTDDTAEIATYAALEQQADFAVISFFKGAKVKLTFTAQNGKSGELELTLEDIIDKTPPVVGIVTQNDTADSTKAVLVFSINEDVTDQTGHEYLAADGNFEKEITKQGTYEYIFTDKAGNTAKVSATVSNIDGTPPAVVFKDMPDESTSQKTSYTFKAAMNEAGTITMLDKSHAAAAPTDFVDGKPNLETITWHDFTVTQNGSYLVIGTDSAGNKSMYYVSIKCIDNKAPNIAMQPSTLKVRQGTETSELTDDILLSGVLITDTVSPLPDIAVNLSGKPTQADLDTVGVYTVNITATDKAGNISETQRYIQVYPKDEPEVLVNGKKTDNNGTTVIIGTYVLNVSVDIPGFNGEPYTLYIRKGDKTAGQMKRNAAVIEGGTYTVAEDGYYTLYIVRQNREIYLTRLYIQK